MDEPPSVRSPCFVLPQAQEGNIRIFAGFLIS